MKNQIEEFMNSLTPEYHKFIDSVCKLHETNTMLVEACEATVEHFGQMCVLGDPSESTTKLVNMLRQTLKQAKESRE